jgi:hypothetical protein
MLPFVRTSPWLWSLALAFLALFGSELHAADLQVTPAQVTLDGNFARAQLVVGDGSGERAADLTRQASYLSTNPQVVTVSAAGGLLAIANGTAQVSVTVGNRSRIVPIQVSGVVAEPKIGFTEQVMPIISKAGCNAGACHASQYGKGGFKLSVFGYAPDEDHSAIARESLGRRINTNNPASSLVLLKPTLGVPHQGGRRLEPGTVDHMILQRWLALGAPKSPASAPTLTALTVYPNRRIGPLGFTQQLRVEAKSSDGSTRDVTALAKFDSMDESIVRIGPDGMLTAVGRGQGAALVRYEGQAEVATVVVPYGEPPALVGWIDQNFIDKLATAKFRELGIPTSGLCDDATFLRRASLDVTGTLPTPAQAIAFLDSRDPDKRKKLVDQLLGLTGDPAQDVHNNAYAAFWSLKWADLLRSSSGIIPEQGLWAFHNWITTSFRENKPFDRFVRELLTARGPTFSNGPANFFRIASNPQELTEATSQLFLGVRLQCAKCHNHPYERLSRADYYGFAAFFARFGNKLSQDFGIFANELVLTVGSAGEVAIPGGKVMPPTPLHGKPIEKMPPDRRAALADWMTAPDNPYFARNIVNRYVGYLMGRGLVDPIDDVRSTNPPSNAALLDALAAEFIKNKYDAKLLLKTILNSRLYQLEAQPTKANAADMRYYSHYQVKRLGAEALLDAIDAAAGTRTKFEKVPLGTRAIELPDAKYNNYFLNTFGKPRREGVCECERTSDPNLAQALHTLNGDAIMEKIAHPTGRIAGLLKANKAHDDIVNELFLATYSRRPTDAERATLAKLRAESPDAKAFYEDLLWTLINSKGFLFVR